MSAIGSQITRAFRHRDFRLLWTGAFFSFVGSWIQTVGQGFVVYKLTRDPAMLALVSFASSLPVSILGPLPGSLVDTFNKKTLLIVAQILLGLTALTLALLCQLGIVQYWHIVVAALTVGIVSAFEMPTRQSAVGQVVPKEDLSAAIPLNALTFNLARLFGPAIGGIVLVAFGVQLCYFLNGISYLALVLAAFAIRADLRASAREPQPILDLVLEGLRYTFGDISLRTLFILESIVSVFGIFYIPLIPAIAADLLHLGPKGLSYCYTSMAVGAVSALLLIASTTERGKRALVLRMDMTLMALGLIALSYARTPFVAYPVLAVLGFCGVAHFNTTNTMFQLLSPEHLRGRVLSMHVWALSGLSPFGVLFFGWLARQTSIRTALQAGATCVMLGAIGAWLSKRGLEAI